MLHRTIYASEAVGLTGETTLSIAQILGVSDRNNRRDHLTSCLMIHNGHILQAIEGARVDIDRLLRRLAVDPRHAGLRVLIDAPVSVRRINEPIALSADPAGLLQNLNLPCLSRITAANAEQMLDIRLAA